MATPIRPENNSQKITCSECLKEIPLSAAFMPEGEGYIGEFCGIECYEQFLAQKKLGKQEKPKRS